MSADRTPEEIFGGRLRAIRERRRWSQADLGDRLRQSGVTLHQTQIARIELGQRNLRLNEASALAQVLNIPLQNLIDASPEEEEDTIELGNVVETEAKLEEQRGILVELIIASGVARERVEETQRAKDKAAADLKWAKDLLATATARHQEASAAHEEMMRRVSAAHRTIGDLEDRLRDAVTRGPAGAREEESWRGRARLPEVASDELEVAIPYGDSMISLRIQQTGPARWNYVVFSEAGTEIMRSGDYSSDDRVRHAREIVKYKLLHEELKIEEIGPR